MWRQPGTAFGHSGHWIDEDEILVWFNRLTLTFSKTKFKVLGNRSTKSEKKLIINYVKTEECLKSNSME